MFLTFLTRLIYVFAAHLQLCNRKWTSMQQEIRLHLVGFPFGCCDQSILHNCDDNILEETEPYCYRQNINVHGKMNQIQMCIEFVEEYHLANANHSQLHGQKWNKKRCKNSQDNIFWGSKNHSFTIICLNFMYVTFNREKNLAHIITSLINMSKDYQLHHNSCDKCVKNRHNLSQDNSYKHFNVIFILYDLFWTLMDRIYRSNLSTFHSSCAF